MPDAVDSPPPTSTARFDWQKHLGLLVGAATSALICLKLLAVSGWDLNTAFGILSANGTTNVLIGALLATLPVLYGNVALLVLPRFERYLSRRSPVERSAARLLEVWPTILVAFIVPLMLLVVIAFFILLPLGVSLFRFIQSKRKLKQPRKNRRSHSSDSPSRFEATSAALGSFAILMFSSLHTPWIAPETAQIDGEARTVYVLSVNADHATVLLHEGRKLAQLDSAQLAGEYCQVSDSIWSAPLPQAWSPPRYSICPG